MAEIGAKSVVVIGGGAAGMSAASRVRRLRPDWPITVLERGDYVSFILCGLPYYVEGLVESEERLVVYTPEFFQTERNIDVRTRHEARRIDTTNRLVEAVDLESGASQTLPYDRLVIAAGAEPVRPRIPGLDLEGVFTLHSIPSGMAIRSFLGSRAVRRAAIIGAGYVGLEMAQALRSIGAEVTLIEALESVLPGGEPEIAALVDEELRRQGVDVRTGQLAQSLEGDSRVRGVVTSDGSLDVDLVLVAVGVRPAVQMASDAGIETGPTGAIATDRRMATNVADVYACGDCAEAHHLLTERPAYVPLGTTANKQGRVAGINAADRNAEFAGIVGTAGFKVFDLEVARTGLIEAQAGEAGFDPVSVVVRFPSRSSYYPGASDLTVKLVADAGSGRVLGAQMCGPGTVAKRIDTVAAALYARMSVADIESLDLSYAPPFAAAWEGIQLAAQRLLEKLQR
jgi:NADPH-dependent 2,4-dienoyl-CoA reductase/sulfur reductase-like enzyme